MNNPPHQNLLDRKPSLPPPPQFSERRWDQRIHYVLWALAAVCMALATLVWWQLLSGFPSTAP